MSGPQNYPGADRGHWYQTKYGGSSMEVNVVVLHTTEGRSLPDYQGGASAPNLTALPDLAAKKLRWYQHFQIDVSSRALVNSPGGVQTNTLNVCQVELVGTCDPELHGKWKANNTPHLYWPQAPEWALREVARFLSWMHHQHGVPLRGPSSWPSYPTSAGNRGGQRMSHDRWNGFRGICGHMHVPENCVHPDTPVLRADLTWQRAGDLPVGAEIVSFDEDDAPDAPRVFRTATVTRNEPGVKGSYRITTPDAEITATHDHPWLVRADGRIAWVPSKELDPFRHRVLRALPTSGWEGAPVAGAGDTAVLGVEYVGERPIASLSTSTRTYVAGGLLCHNTHGDPGSIDFETLIRFAKGA
ncbi:hypothetical protein IAG44_11370 [Streptomyces roseirectus]|uniref:Hint domain-containing protein n=1 Tax=Streptomyces roseirectus TaxID=2768066 RepID=A0A7H0ISD4_9ACTN|nr:Hint domain-containing protein [Streptomyces roseirectus]QNP75700.1 hypothetical protein IAG44_11370 [Streptomyces roseirectus]